MMIIVAIDYGKSRIGLAAADCSASLAYPAGVIVRRSLERDLATLRIRLKDLEANRVIVGLPLNMDGTAGPAARAAERFAQDLHNATGLRVDLQDERLSTFEAGERLKSTSRSGRRRVMLDEMAAVVILESWLQAQEYPRQ